MNNGQKLVQVQQNLEGLETNINDTTDDLLDKVNKLTITVNGFTQSVSDSGGNNIFYYAKEFWTNGTDEGLANLEEYTNTEIQSKSVSGEGYILNSGISEQKCNIQNGNNYTISFTYKKLVDLATGYVQINGVQYDLDNTDWTNFEESLYADTETIDIIFYSDTNNAFQFFDLMGNIGTEKEIWTQNPNETRTDTVTIGKGIEIDSNSKNTYTRIDADGNRIYSSRTNEVVSEFTDKGIVTDDMQSDTATIAGVLIQKIDGQTWFSSLL